MINDEPRQKGDYGGRQVDAARRVLVDIGQVLASFRDCIVVVGGWVPELLLADAEEPHIGSIDVDLALDAARLRDGRYAELLGLLLNTRRYQKGKKDFQLVSKVDLQDEQAPVLVEVEFLAPKEIKLKRRGPKLVDGFRVLQTEACGVSFHAPVERQISGNSVRGDQNTVRLNVASIPDFLLMKAHAIAGRDKPKDTYDFCYCLTHVSGGMEVIADEWRRRGGDAVVGTAIAVLREKFSTVRSFGPGQLVEFHAETNVEVQHMHARRAYELVRQFLDLIDAP